MMRILGVMLMTALGVVFGAQNWDNVPLHLLVGPPTRVRLVFLLLIAAALGYVTALVRSFGREVRLRAENRRLHKQLRACAAATREEEPEDAAIELVPRER